MRICSSDKTSRKVAWFKALGVIAWIFAACLAPAGIARAEGAENTRLPADEKYLGRTKDYTGVEPDADYRNASPAAYEAFRDMKYGVRIHWGIYSIRELQHESWPFLKMPLAKRQEYQELYKTWNPTGFDAGEWMALFKDNGLKMFAFTAKHHEGFCMFDTRTRVARRVNWTAPGGPVIENCDLAYGIMETPFKRDVVKELCDAAHKYGVKIDLYFSNPDWYDADFRPYGWHPLQTAGSRDDQLDFGGTYNPAKFAPLVMMPDPTPEEQARMMTRYRQQLTELLTNYGKIDMVCLDNYFGKRNWPETRETIKALRKIQPDVMFRTRGINNYGDYYTPEHVVPGGKASTDMPWFVVYPLGGTFSYESSAAKYKGARWIVTNLVDCVAKGGNFMVGIGPDESGKFHPTAIEQLREAGAWLKVNGEAIYATRPREDDLWKEGDALRFTRSKDYKTVYAISQKWPGEKLIVASVRPRPDSAITMLGWPVPLKWTYAEGHGLTVELPASLQNEDRRPSKIAYAFKIEV
jgi:alpha-L-fucosidase